MYFWGGSISGAAADAKVVGDEINDLKKRIKGHLKGTLLRNTTLDTLRLVMTVKELVERLSTENQDALVYTMAHDDDIALIVTDVKQDILAGSDKTIVLLY